MEFHPYGDVDKVARLIPTGTNNIQNALKDITEFQLIYETDQTTKRLIDTAQHLEGVVRHTSTHAAGVVITKEPLVNYLPLQRPSRNDASTNMAMTQFPMEPIAKLGLLKMDFLGLTNLTILSEAKDFVLNRRGIDIHLNEIPLDDIFVCYHDDKDNCDCRKPKPGLLLEAGKKWNVDFKKSFMIGDRWRDIEAGKNLGCKTIFLDYKYNETKPKKSSFVSDTLLNAVHIIEKHIYDKTQY